MDKVTGLSGELASYLVCYWCGFWSNVVGVHQRLEEACCIIFQGWTGFFITARKKPRMPPCELLVMTVDFSCNNGITISVLVFSVQLATFSVKGTVYTFYLAWRAALLTWNTGFMNKLLGFACSFSNSVHCIHLISIGLRNTTEICEVRVVIREQICSGEGWICLNAWVWN
jgi:hypothetical protein